MRKLVVFNHVSLDGYFVDATNSMVWAKMNQHDAEWTEFVAKNASGESPLLFGRITYELMTNYWPTPMAREHDTALAERMNALPKVVFSRTLDKATWNNTRLVKSDMPEHILKMKQESGDGLVILGSGSIVVQLAGEGLIDEFQVVVNPIVLGKGRTMFEGLKQKLNLALTNSRVFKNGNAFLCYQPCS
jgi:dihydrofolate reductase